MRLFKDLKLILLEARSPGNRAKQLQKKMDRLQKISSGATSVAFQWNPPGMSPEQRDSRIALANKTGDRAHKKRVALAYQLGAKKMESELKADNEKRKKKEKKDRRKGNYGSMYSSRTKGRRSGDTD